MGFMKLDVKRSENGLNVVTSASFAQTNVRLVPEYLLTGIVKNKMYFYFVVLQTERNERRFDI